MLDSLKTHNINGEAIKTGNIVFSSVKRNISSDYILQASAEGFFKFTISWRGNVL